MVSCFDLKVVLHVTILQPAVLLYDKSDSEMILTNRLLRTIVLLHDRSAQLTRLRDHLIEWCKAQHTQTLLSWN